MAIWLLIATDRLIANCSWPSDGQLGLLMARTRGADVHQRVCRPRPQQPAPQEAEDVVQGDSLRAAVGTHRLLVRRRLRRGREVRRGREMHRGQGGA